MKMKVIGISANGTGAGKSTVAKMLAGELCEFDPGFIAVHIDSFGGLLKEIAKNEKGWDGQKGPAGRSLLTSLADELKAQHGDDFFVRHMQKKWMSPVMDGRIALIIDDVRFFHPEVEWLTTIGAKIIRVESPQAQASTHNSENSLSVADHRQYFADVICNEHNCGLDALRKRVKIFVDNHKRWLSK